MSLFVILILIVGSAPHADAAPGHGGAHGGGHGGEHGGWHGEEHGGWHGEEHGGWHGEEHDGWHGEEHEHDFHERGWYGAPGDLAPDLDLDVRSYCPNPPGYYPTVPECAEPWIRMR
jgi:hypothetical protein